MRDRRIGRWLIAGCATATLAVLALGAAIHLEPIPFGLRSEIVDGREHLSGAVCRRGRGRRVRVYAALCRHGRRADDRGLAVRGGAMDDGARLEERSRRGQRPARVSPRIDAFHVEEIATAAELAQVHPTYVVLNADYARAVPPESDWGSMIDGLERDALGYRRVSRHP